jgi:hypothetical protein
VLSPRLYERTPDRQDSKRLRMTEKQSPGAGSACADAASSRPTLPCHINLLAQPLIAHDIGPRTWRQSFGYVAFPRPAAPLQRLAIGEADRGQ